MNRKDLYDKAKRVAEKNGDGKAFENAYPSFSVYEQKNYSSHDKVVKLIEKLKSIKVLSTDWTVEQFYKSFACDLEWAKTTTYCKGTPPTSTDDYVGSYKTETTPEENFEITKKSGEYFVSARGVDVRIVKTTGDNFKIESTVPPASGTISFKRDSNNKVTGGSADVKVGIGILSKELKGTFIRVGVTPSPGTEPDKPEDSKYDFSPWKCINNWNEWWGYYKLLGGWEGLDDKGKDIKFAYEYTSHKVNGRKVKLAYYEDGKVVMRYKDDDTDVPGGTGKWACDTEGTGYSISWDNGQVAVFGRNKGDAEIGSVAVAGSGAQSSGGGKPTSTDGKPTSGSGTSTATSTGLPKYKEVCKATLPCPTRKSVEEGKASYKICMKCPEIGEFQNNPVFKIIYFQKLKDNGFAQKTDNIFGPITKAAVEEYQEMNGLVKDGIIGIKTLAQLEKDK